MAINTVIPSLKKLEEWGVITCVGRRAANPLAPYRTTKVYKISLERLRQLARPESPDDVERV